MSRLGRCRAALMIALIALGGACSAPVDSEPRTLRAASIPADLRGETSTTTTTIISTGEFDEVTVYFIRGDRLEPVLRRVSPPVTLEKVLGQLFTGPTDPEAMSGLRTAVSADTTILGAPIRDRIATIDVSRNFAVGTLEDRITAFAQVVFTAVDVEGVTGVRFAVEGQPQEAPQGDGSQVSAPLGRASYPQRTPR